MSTKSIPIQKEKPIQPLKKGNDTINTTWESSAKYRDIFIKTARNQIPGITISYSVMGRNCYLIEACSKDPMDFYKLGLVAGAVIETFQLKKRK